MVVIGQSGCVREKVVVFEQKLFYSGIVVVFKQKWLYSSKVVVFGQKCLYSGKNVCIWTEVDVFGQKWLYSGKVVVFGQKYLYSGKVVVFGQKLLNSGKSCCIRAKWLYSGKTGCDREMNALQFCTFQKPLNKYLYIPFESFHPASNKRVFIKGELMRYARNSSNFTTFANTCEPFLKRLRLRGDPYHFLLPLFREVKYSNRIKWLKKSKRALDGKVIVFKTTYNRSHLHIKGFKQKYLPELK